MNLANSLFPVPAGPKKQKVPFLLLFNPLMIPGIFKLVLEKAGSKKVFNTLRTGVLLTKES